MLQYEWLAGGANTMVSAMYSKASSLIISDTRALFTMRCEQAFSGSIELRPEERNQHARECHFIWFTWFCVAFCEFDTVGMGYIKKAPQCLDDGDGNVDISTDGLQYQN
jgi:hypothetical protein